MIVSRQNDDFEPLTWARGVPIYATTLLVALHVAALLAGWVAMAFHQSALLDPLIFRSAAVLQEGAVWQWVTYLFVQPLHNPLFFAIEMFLLYAFGREVERYIGRRHYLLLYGVLVVIPPILLTWVGLFLPSLPLQLAGTGHVHFAIFMAFAALYPGVEFFFRIQARWLAAAILALYAIFYLASHQWSSFCALISDAAMALLFVGWLRGTVTVPRISLRPRGTPARKPKPPAPARDPMETIDPLLDKIAREGMASLTSAERTALENAREELLSRQKSG